MIDRPPSHRPRLLVFADDWGRHPSSCQHLVRRLLNDMDVTWVNTIGTRRLALNAHTARRAWEKIRNWSRGLQPSIEGPQVIDAPMLPGLARPAQRCINRNLVGARLRRALPWLDQRPPVVLTTLPYTGWLVRDVPRSGLIYYCTDDYTHWPSADAATLRQADREITEEADLVLAASESLVESHRHHAACEYFPHGVDFEHFASPPNSSFGPPELAGSPGPRLGFFGLIYEKLDFALLAAVARRFPQAMLVLIGPVDYCPHGLTQLPNVRFVGKVAYGELPRYLAGLDVLLLPYRADDAMIRQSGPLKLRECLATGKPTVSVDVPENRRFAPHVRIGRTTEEFLNHVAEAMREPAESPARPARQASVRHDGWEARASVLRAHVERLAFGDVSRARTSRAAGGSP